VIRMGILNRSRQANEARRQHRRARRLSHATAVHKLGRTYTFPVGATIPAVTRNVRVQEIALRMQLRLYTQPGFVIPIAKGMLFALGGTNIGMAAWFQGDTRIGFGVGMKPASLPTGIQTWTQQLSEYDLAAGDRDYPVDLAFAVRPGDGTFRAWWNGRMILNGQTSAATFQTNPAVPSVWGGQVAGAFFATPAQIPRVAIITSLPNASVTPVSPLSIYTGKRPWHYDTGPIDPNDGPILIDPDFGT